MDIEHSVDSQFGREKLFSVFAFDNRGIKIKSQALKKIVMPLILFLFWCNHFEIK